MIKLYQPFTIEVYTTLENLYIVVNLHILKKGYAITIKQFKKNKKGELQKVWI